MSADPQTIMSNMQAAYAPNSFTDEQVRSYVQQNLQGATDAQIAAEMARFNVGVDQMARVTGQAPRDVQSRFLATASPSPTVIRPQGFTDAQVLSYLQNNLQGASDSQIAAEMIRFGVSPAQMSRVTNVPLETVQNRYNAIINPLLSASTLTGGTTTTTTTNTDGTTTGGGTTLPSNIVPTPSVTSPAGTVPTLNAALPALPTQPTEYITPGGGITSIPTGVTPFAVPMLNMRNIANQGVVPSYVAAPQTTPQFAFTPITQIGTPVF